MVMFYLKDKHKNIPDSVYAGKAAYHLFRLGYGPSIFNKDKDKENVIRYFFEKGNEKEKRFLLLALFGRKFNKKGGENKKELDYWMQAIESRTDLGDINIECYKTMRSLFSLQKKNEEKEEKGENEKVDLEKEYYLKRVQELIESRDFGKLTSSEIYDELSSMIFTKKNGEFSRDIEILLATAFSFFGYSCYDKVMVYGKDVDNLLHPKIKVDHLEELVMKKIKDPKKETVDAISDFFINVYEDWFSMDPSNVYRLYPIFKQAFLQVECIAFLEMHIVDFHSWRLLKTVPEKEARDEFLHLEVDRILANPNVARLYCEYFSEYFDTFSTGLGIDIVDVSMFFDVPFELWDAILYSVISSLDGDLGDKKKRQETLLYFLRRILEKNVNLALIARAVGREDDFFNKNKYKFHDECLILIMEHYIEFYYSSESQELTGKIMDFLGLLFPMIKDKKKLSLVTRKRTVKKGIENFLSIDEEEVHGGGGDKEKIEILKTFFLVSHDYLVLLLKDYKIVLEGFNNKMDNFLKKRDFFNKQNPDLVTGECSICYDTAVLLPSQCFHFYCESCYLNTFINMKNSCAMCKQPWSFFF